MKKTVKVVAVVMSVLMLMLCLASCGALSGTYENEATGMEIKFSGSKFTMTMAGFGEDMELKGTYKVDGDKITFEFEADDDADEIVKAAVEEMNEELKDVDFEEGDDYIKIDGIKFTKK